ncbi:MAG: hypothetical protein IJH70_16205 [Oscillospiraceae bacterium]|nr:hypothetical protein [Oscillospiraceae bacterium]
MLCANVLICRQKDYIPVHIIMELNENVAIPLRSMLMFYFVQAVCENLSLKKSIRVMDHLLDLIGGRDFLEKSGMTDYDGINRFSRGECRYLLSFTEYLYDLYHLDKDDYAVSFINFSDKQESSRPRFMAALISEDAPKREPSRLSAARCWMYICCLCLRSYSGSAEKQYSTYGSQRQ